jgi:hypothetical protein
LTFICSYYLKRLKVSIIELSVHYQPGSSGIAGIMTSNKKVCKVYFEGSEREQISALFLLM